MLALTRHQSTHLYKQSQSLHCVLSCVQSESASLWSPIHLASPTIDKKTISSLLRTLARLSSCHTPWSLRGCHKMRLHWTTTRRQTGGISTRVLPSGRAVAPPSDDCSAALSLRRTVAPPCDDIVLPKWLLAVARMYKNTISRSDQYTCLQPLRSRIYGSKLLLCVCVWVYLYTYKHARPYVHTHTHTHTPIWCYLDWDNTWILCSYFNTAYFILCTKIYIFLFIFCLFVCSNCEW